MHCSGPARGSCSDITAQSGVEQSLHVDLQWSGESSADMMRHMLQVKLLVPLQILAECLQLLRSSASHPEHAHLCILLSSAAVERALGDVSRETYV